MWHMLSKFSLVSFCWLLLAGLQVNGQQYIYNYNIPFTENGRSLKYPTAGGLNNPQFSNIDVNQDGKQDIFMFDRSGNKPMILLNNGNSGEVNYTYWQGYENIFPKM